MLSRSGACVLGGNVCVLRSSSVQELLSWQVIYLIGVEFDCYIYNNDNNNYKSNIQSCIHIMVSAKS